LRHEYKLRNFCSSYFWNPKGQPCRSQPCKTHDWTESPLWEYNFSVIQKCVSGWLRFHYTKRFEKRKITYSTG